jgi:hypothetical protein
MDRVTGQGLATNRLDQFAKAAYKVAQQEHVAAKACPGLDPVLHDFADNNMLQS